MSLSDPSNHFATECRVSIIIKALNEEKRIVAAVETALRAVATVGGEVILADSCSSDRTVELASHYPIRIVQLANSSERCCGIGPQLGYQHSCGEFVYIMDGDMEMLPGFLEPALAFLAGHPDVAGIGGQVIEQNTESLEYIARMERASSHMRPGEVDRLDMGGLYRRSAIEQAGYFSNRHLHSYEEFDLAVRLRALGWHFWRLSMPSVNHYGHDAPPYQLLLRRWRTGYIFGLGELLRGAIGKPHLILVLKGVRELRLYATVIAWWLILASVIVWPVSSLWRLFIFLGLLLFPGLVMTWRKRSIAKACFSIVSWCFNSMALMSGLTHAHHGAVNRVSSVIVRDLVDTKKVKDREIVVE